MTRPAAVLDGNFARWVGSGGGIFGSATEKDEAASLSSTEVMGWVGEGKEVMGRQRESPPEMPNLMVL